MATLPNSNPTLLDWKKSLNPDGSPAATIEILNQTNEVLDDITFIEGNLPTGHRHVVRTGLPTPTEYALYGKVKPTKSRREQLTDNAMMLQDYMEIDPELLALEGGGDAFKTNEAVAHIEGFGQYVASSIFYANEAVNPAQFTGLAPRFNDKDAENGVQLINGGGTGSDNNSIWLVGWSPRTCFMFYPKGSSAGLDITSKGVQTVTFDDGSRAERDITHMKWNLGLAVADWRYVVRICNVDLSELTADASGNSAKLIRLLTQAVERVHGLEGVRPAIYMPRTIREFLRLQTVEAVKSSTLSMDTVAGRRVLAFDGIPVRRVDALKAHEASISFA